MRGISREENRVELVGPDGAATGSATVDEAHQPPGCRHRAFSVFLRDQDGRVLLQQRAAGKTRFPLRWANACCGHPAPGEDVATAAERRLAEEIGVAGVSLAEVGRYSYYAEDPDSGRVEYEFDHVLLGDLPPGSTLRPDPCEVADVRWVPLAELVRDLRGEPRQYAPWLAGVTERLVAYLGGALETNEFAAERDGTTVAERVHAAVAGREFGPADWASAQADHDTTPANRGSGPTDRDRDSVDATEGSGDR